MNDQHDQDDEPAVEENEVLREARLAKEARERAEASAEAASKAQRKIGWKTAAAAGLGSAAIMAALIYATRNKDES